MAHAADGLKIALHILEIRIEKMKTSNLYWDARCVFLPVMKENSDYCATPDGQFNPQEQHTSRLKYLRDIRQFIPFQQRLYMIQLARKTYNEYFNI